MCIRQSLKKHPSIVKKGRRNTSYDSVPSTKRISENTSVSEISSISGDANVQHDERKSMIPKV